MSRPGGDFIGGGSVYDVGPRDKGGTTAPPPENKLTVKITQPVNGFTWKGGPGCQVMFTVTGPSPLVRASIRVDGVIQITMDSKPGFPLDSKPLQAKASIPKGTHDIVATAIDSLGNQATSAVVKVTRNQA